MGFGLVRLSKCVVLVTADGFYCSEKHTSTIIIWSVFNIIKYLLVMTF